MTNETNGAPAAGGPSGVELTDAEKLAALGTYLKALKTIEGALRDAVADDMRRRKVEKVSAYLPDGERLGSVGYRAGSKTGRVINEQAALAWALKNHPEAVVQTVNPAFMKALTDHAAKVGQVGEPGVDPETGEVLDFIEVRQGAPSVAITTTKEGVERMTRLAHGFAGMLEARTPEDDQLDDLLARASVSMKATLDAEIDVEQRLSEVLNAAGLLSVPRVQAQDAAYDPDFADRLENGAYDR